MATRAITGTVLRPSGAPWAGGEVNFTPTDDAFTLSPDQTIPRDVVTAVVGTGGTFSVVLVSGLSVLYEVTLPDQSTFPIAVPDGGAATLEALRAATSVSPVPIETVQEVIEGLIAGTYVESAGGDMTGDLTMAPPVGAAGFNVNPSGANHGEFRWRRGGVTKWRGRNVGSDDHWALYNEALAANAIDIDDATNAITLGGALTVPGATTLTALTGGGTRMVTAGPAGALSTGAIPQSGLVLLNTTPFSGVTIVPVTDVFSAAYDDYKIELYADVFGTNVGVLFRLRVGGTEDTAATGYAWENYIFNNSTGAISGSTGQAVTQVFGPAVGGTLQDLGVTINLHTPFSATTKTVGNGLASGFRGGIDLATTIFGIHYTSDKQHTGFSFLPGAGVFSGVVRTYGLQNA